MAREKIFQGFISSDPKMTFWHGHSFTANPLGCAAANASLDLLKMHPDKYINFESRHLFHLNKISKHPKVKRPRLKGTIAAFDIVIDGPNSYLNDAGKKLKNKVMEKGVFIRPLGNVVYLLPPLCISDDQLEQCYSAIQTSLDQI